MPEVAHVIAGDRPDLAGGCPAVGEMAHARDRDRDIIPRAAEERSATSYFVRSDQSFARSRLSLDRRGSSSADVAIRDVSPAIMI